ncbi:hypothetical protein UPYG_G00320080 [Umbra pygmaea]|uniref:Ternary complex factor MIP1 leucine-zipper domain-containing protein n=1 Tax=Umbra pygmaea TaxID=75934 RepID=A0ABD0W0A0_UMBPY
MPDSKEGSLPAVANNHDYACHPSPGKLDSATQRIRELELQVLSLEIEIQHLTVRKQHPVLFKFCVTDGLSLLHKIRLKGGLHCVLGVCVSLCFTACVLV